MGQARRGNIDNFFESIEDFPWLSVSEILGNHEIETSSVNFEALDGYLLLICGVIASLFC